MMDVGGDIFDMAGDDSIRAFSECHFDSQDEVGLDLWANSVS